MSAWLPVNLALAVLTAWLGSARAAEAEEARLGFVYVEANVGGASGGHFGLRLGDKVYDYRAAETGLLVLDRRDRDRFVFHYGSLENRPIHMADVEVSPDVFRRVRDGFAREYLAQRRELAALASAQENLELLDALAGERAGVRSRGAGLLDPRTNETPAGVELRIRIEAERGADFLSHEGERIERELGAVVPSSGEALARYRELLTLRAALLALRAAQGLDPAAVIVPEGARLSARERSLLRQFLERLAASVIALLDSARPDRGHVLFLAAARHHAVSRSLDESRLVLLDPLHDGPPVLDARAVARQRDELAAVARHADALYDAERAWQLSRPSLEARGYQRLEELAARQVEYRAALAHGHPIRAALERRPPERRRELAPLPTTLSGDSLRGARKTAREQLDRARASLADARGYDLVTRNCATQVVATLSRVLGGSDAAASALGGTLQPGSGFDFVPFALFDQVRRRLPVASAVRISSYRERRLAELSGAGRLSRLREATALTSTIYRPRHLDTSFLLFTDDVFWRRPLYGIINLGYGLATAVAGIASAPFDRGRRLERGSSGVLFSLPELGLFNIRKGSFDAASLERQGAL